VVNRFWCTFAQVLYPGSRRVHGPGEIGRAIGEVRQHCDCCRSSVSVCHRAAGPAVPEDGGTAAQAGHRRPVAGRQGSGSSFPVLSTRVPPPARIQASETLADVLAHAMRQDRNGYLRGCRGLVKIELATVTLCPSPDSYSRTCVASAGQQRSGALRGARSAGHRTRGGALDPIGSAERAD